MAADDILPRMVLAPSAEDERRHKVRFENGGEMTRLIAECDWSSSPIGPPETWPKSLTNAVGLILPAAAQIVLFWGPEFVAIYNSAYAPTIGDKHPRALGRPARENWAELWDDLEPLLQGVRDTGETVFAKDRPFYIERHGYPETVYFDISYSAIPDGSGGVGGVLCIVGETTERVLAEKALLALNETLESRVAEEIARRSKAEDVLRQAQKMETVGQLSGGIAHDFNNLLQIIHGNLSLLQRFETLQDDKGQRALSNALEGARRASTLTQRLLAFSRSRPLDARPVDVNRLIGDMTELLHRTLGETITIETRLGDDLPPAHADANQLENAVLNLAINARDAMPGGGVLEIRTDLAEPNEEHSGFSGKSNSGRFVRVAVRDSGTGMSADVLERAVEPFFSTKEVGHGTGLGLSTVYGFVRQSGGHMVLHSREGQGTIVEILLPCSGDLAEKQEERATSEDVARGRGERVLLCEDDEGVRLFSSETLRELGYSVVESSNAAEALSAMLDHPRFDLLFTDVVLPGGKTGADLAREARKLQPDLKVLFTTGYARKALDADQALARPIELLPKPFTVEQLAQRLRKLLD